MYNESMLHCLAGSCIKVPRAALQCCLCSERNGRFGEAQHIENSGLESLIYILIFLYHHVDKRFHIYMYCKRGYIHWGEIRDYYLL